MTCCDLDYFENYGCNGRPVSGDDVLVTDSWFEIPANSTEYIKFARFL
jgi:hypothetical protein